VKKIEHAYELVKALSKSEKRSFKLYTQHYANQAGNSYIRLFEILDRMKVYKEVAIRQQFHSKQKRTPLNGVVVYLIEIIMKSLSVYHASNTKGANLKDLLLRAMILKEKGFRAESEKLSDKVKKIANTYEDFITLLEVYTPSVFLARGDKTLVNITEKKEALKKTENILAYQTILAEMSERFGRQEILRNKEEEKVLKKILNQPLLHSEDQALSIVAKQLFYYIKCLCNLFLGENERALAHTEKMKYYITRSPELLQFKINDYIVCIKLMMHLNLDLKRYEAVNRMVEKLLVEFNNKTNSLNTKTKVQLFRTYASGKLNLIITTGRFCEENFLPEMEKNINKYAPLIEEETLILIYINMAIIYFSFENYKASLLWLNKSLSILKMVVNSDLHVITHLFNIILHYEIGNDEFVLHLQKAAKRFLHKKKRLFESESILLNFFNKLILTSDSKIDKKQYFNQLKSELNEAFKNPLEANMLINFDFIAWADAKLQGRSFLSVVREKAEV